MLGAVHLGDIPSAHASKHNQHLAMSSNNVCTVQSAAFCPGDQRLQLPSPAAHAMLG